MNFTCNLELNDEDKRLFIDYLQAARDLMEEREAALRRAEKLALMLGAIYPINGLVGLP